MLPTAKISQVACMEPDRFRDSRADRVEGGGPDAGQVDHG